MMSQYLYQLRPTRPAMLSDGPTQQEQGVVEAHFAYLQGLLDKRVVLMAGRTLTEDESTFGIVVLEAQSERCARALMLDDPAVSEGVMEAQLYPYRVALWSAAGPSS